MKTKQEIVNGLDEALQQLDAINKSGLADLLGTAGKVRDARKFVADDSYRDMFPIVLALCRSASVNANSVVKQQIKRLRDWYDEDGQGNRAMTLTGVLERIGKPVIKTDIGLSVTYPCSNREEMKEIFQAWCRQWNIQSPSVRDYRDYMDEAGVPEELQKGAIKHIQDGDKFHEWMFTWYGIRGETDESADYPCSSWKSVEDVREALRAWCKEWGMNVQDLRVRDYRDFMDESGVPVDIQKQALKVVNTKHLFFSDLQYLVSKRFGTRNLDAGGGSK